ncbi:glycosyltransferase family 4 protein [Chloroflexota bacterium]
MNVIFIHNRAIWYRIPFFKRLANLYDAQFVFTHEKEVNGLDSINFIQLNTHFGIAFGLIPILLRGDYDVIVVAGWSNLTEFIEGIICLAAAKIRGKPAISWFEHWFPQLPDIRRRLAAPFIGFIMKRFSACIAPGSKTKELCINMGIEPEKIFVAPNASVLDKEKGLDVRKTLGLDGKKIILYFSRVIPRKGLNYLIEAVSRLRKEGNSVFLLICGEGDFMDRCVSLCKKLEVEDVHFAGFIEPKNRYHYFSTANVFVLPTISLNGRVESWGLVLNEAMSVGKPVISTTAVASAYDLIENGVNGFVVPDKDADSLYEALRTILSDHELEKTMGINSKKIIDGGFTYDHMANGFKQAIDYVLGIRVK